MKRIIVLNAGSSSVKFALIETGGDGPERELARGLVDGIGETPRWSVKGANGQTLESGSLPEGTGSTHKGAIARILGWIEDSYSLTGIAGAGHRVVHGGADFAAPIRLDRRVAESLHRLTPLAPLHQPHNLAAIDSLFELAPTLPQIACFDTAFHATMPPVARNFALPRVLTEKGVRRYGFHGISYAYIASELAKRAPEYAGKRIIVAHLGNGASLCAIREGKSIATTMGFSALDGLMMGTRSGTIDPAVIFHLMRSEGMSADTVEAMLYKQSGLLGVSGLSNDMRTLRDAAKGNPVAAEAIALFTYRIIRDIGSLAAALGGLDALVFTAGIGENDAELRADVIEGLGFLRLRLDPDANRAGKTLITTAIGPVGLVIPTNEEIMIARETAALI